MSWFSKKIFSLELGVSDINCCFSKSQINSCSVLFLLISFSNNSLSKSRNSSDISKSEVSTSSKFSIGISSTIQPINKKFFIKIQ